LGLQQYYKERKGGRGRKKKGREREGEGYARVTTNLVEEEGRMDGRPGEKSAGLPGLERGEER